MEKNAVIDRTEQPGHRVTAEEERDKYSHLLDAVPGGIAVFDIIRGKRVELNYFNDEICKLTGYSREEIISRGIEKLCESIPEDFEEVHKTVRQALHREPPVDIEYRTRKKSGELRYFRARIAVEKTGEETLTVYVVYTDVTIQKRAEFAVATESEILSKACGNDLLGKCRANVSKDIVDNYVADENLIITAENPKYSDAARRIAEVCATRDMRDLFMEKMMPDRLAQTYASGVDEFSLEYLRRMKDETFQWVRTRVRMYAEPGTQDVMCFMYTYNIDREKTLKLIVDHVTNTEFDMLAIIYRQSALFHCVRASRMEELMEIGLDVRYREGMREYISRYVAEDLQEEVFSSLRLEKICQELETKQIYTVSYAVNFQGRTRQKKWELSFLDDSREMIIMTRSDVTELLEEQMRQREYLKDALIQAEQASHAKTDFLSHMSHEIRTPMNAIIGMSTLAAQCINDPKQVAECISKVGISARFLLSLINDILDMSRIESGKFTLKNEKFLFEDLLRNINTIIYNQARSKGIDYDCVITSFVNTYYIGDATKLQQILINLLGNAVKFTPAGGKAQFIVHQNRVTGGRASMTFTVNDTGIGISEEFQKRMFAPFEQEYVGTTSLYQGTGLGLAICKNLVDMMGGVINVNSIEGVGSEFTVTVPLGICEEEESYPIAAEIPFEKLHALVVDDDVLICENTNNILREMGMQAEWVSSGKQAVCLIGDRKTQNLYFDIVLLDWKMPDMDGIETARQIRGVVGPDVTIIVITAYDWSAIEAEAKAAGVNLLITKPLFKSTLMSAFQRVFTEKAQKEEPHTRVEYDFTGKRLLLVEDHILNVEVAKRLLEGKHACVEVAENGLRAIEMFAKAPDSYYDAILMDIRMPVMDGLTSARSIRQLSNPRAMTVPIIAMSANAFDEDVEKSKAAGMNAHLAKPIEPQLLYATLDRYFQNSEN